MTKQMNRVSRKTQRRKGALERLQENTSSYTMKNREITVLKNRTQESFTLPIKTKKKRDGKRK